MTTTPDTRYSETELTQRRQLRVLVLLNAAAAAGVEPVRLAMLHSLAYLSNALAPVWHLTPFDGAVLKRRGGPYYPALQWDVDRMVGCGLLHVQDISYVEVDSRWQIDASYCLNHAMTRSILETRRAVGFEPGLEDFCSALAQAMAALPPEEVERLLGEDASYGNPSVDVSNVVNFAESHGVNFATNAARAFRPDVPLTAGERVNMYVNHLHVRLVRRGK